MHIGILNVPRRLRGNNPKALSNFSNPMFTHFWGFSAPARHPHVLMFPPDTLGQVGVVNSKKEIPFSVGKNISSSHSSLI